VQKKTKALSKKITKAKSAEAGLSGNASDE
jgi:hypothetical protein